MQASIDLAVVIRDCERIARRVESVVRVLGIPGIIQPVLARGHAIRSDDGRGCFAPPSLQGCAGRFAEGWSAYPPDAGRSVRIDHLEASESPDTLEAPVPTTAPEGSSHVTAADPRPLRAFEGVLVERFCSGVADRLDIGSGRVNRREAPSKASEDSASVPGAAPGALVLRGAAPDGGSGALHSERAVFDDRGLGSQVAVLADLTRRRRESL